jgi:hypothetical protein
LWARWQGAMTKTNIVGFIGGMNVPLIKKFEYGYRAGVLTTNAQARVLVGYTGNWDDVNKGRELALTQFNQGADIIYHAAGRCGVGVIRAAQQKGKGYYAIGVDSDQDHLAPGRVLTSMMKRVDNAVFDVCQRVARGQFRSGTVVYGVREKGVGLSPMRFTRKDVPDSTHETGANAGADDCGGQTQTALRRGDLPPIQAAEHTDRGGLTDATQRTERTGDRRERVGVRARPRSAKHREDTAALWAVHRRRIRRAAQRTLL